jgi:hypothetical protein
LHTRSVPAVQRRVNGVAIPIAIRPEFPARAIINGDLALSGLQDLVADTDTLIGEEKSWLI